MKLEISLRSPIVIRWLENKNSHKSKASVIALKEARKSLKPPCINCGKQVPLGRQKLCSEKCSAIYNKTRSHHKIITFK